jgi:hypothetical protein
VGGVFTVSPARKRYVSFTSFQVVQEENMKLLRFMKDGGPLSRVTGLFVVEIKKLFSVVLLHFFDGSREAYHSHAFNAVSWVLRGKLVENALDGKITEYKPGLKPIFTPRSMFHKVVSAGDTWVISFRGPWVNTWKEYLPAEERFVTLTHGRRVVETA